MRRWMKTLCLVLAMLCLLCACQSAVAPTTPTTTTPTTPALPQLADVNRPLPVLAEKNVTDTPADGDLILSRDGVAEAAVVYPTGNSKALSAANDLCSYLGKITGAAFTPIADDQPLPEGNLILVGYTAKTAELGFAPITGYPDAEEYRIAVKDNCLVLYGNDDRSYTCTQFAVTRFLEEAGCGWFSEEEQWNVIPNSPTLAVKQWEMTAKPLFASRMMGWYGQTILKRWYTGGDSFSFGHTLWTGKSGILNPSLYETHPDWFALINGERAYPAGYWQPCYTNQELIEYLAQIIIKNFNNNASLTTYSVSPNDGWDEGWCDCETCLSKGNRSDQVLYFANEIAKIVCEVHPDRRINFLAYHETFLPPESGMKAHPNVEVMFTMETNPFTDPTLDYVVHSGLNDVTKVTYTQSWQDNVNDWIEKTDLQHTSIWSWLCISTGNGLWTGAPWIQGNTVTNTFQLYQQMGVDVIFADWGQEILQLRWPLIYTYARCMWDDAVDAETVLYDACKKLYGEAADEIFLYYRLLADCAAINVDDSGITWVPPTMYTVYGDYVDQLYATVEAARAKLDQLTPEQRKRAEFQLATWAYVEAKM